MRRFSKARVVVLALFVALPVAASVAAAPTPQAQAQAPAQEPEARPSRQMPEPEPTYQLPPEVVQDLFARDRSYATLGNLSPDGDHFLVPGSDSDTTLEQISRTTYRLAGLEFRPQSNRQWRLDLGGTTGLRFFSLATRAYTEVPLPDGVWASDYVWSPAGDRLAFLAHLRERTEVWVADVAAGRAESLSDAAVNATIGAGGRGGSGLLQWTPEGTILTLVVRPDRGPEPVDGAVPPGPVIRTTRERETATRTIPFLLEDEHDADLFEHYTTSRIAELAPGAEPRLIGEPGMYTSVSLSPDGRHLLTERIARPFSFIVSWSSFPRTTEVMDRDGDVLATLIEQPLREGGGRGGRGGDQGGNRPRELGWRPDGKGLTFLQQEPRRRDEAADRADAAGGRRGRARGAAPQTAREQDEEAEDEEPRNDRIMLLAAPFDMEQAQVVADNEQRLSGHRFSRDGSHVFAEFTEEGDRNLAVWGLGADGRAAADRDVIVGPWDPDELLEQPGGLMAQRTPNGITYVLMSTDKGRVYLEGPGLAEDHRPTPFVDAVSLADRSKERIFEGSKDSWDRPLVPLDPDLQRMIVARESRTDFPDSFLWRRDDSMEQLTDNADPFPEITAARRIDFTFTRRDGVEIRGELSLPLDYVDGTRVPAVFWTYPREYDSVEEYEESTIRGTNLNRFPHLGFRSESDVWLTQGYALVVPDIPIIGEPYNDKYVQHLVDSMYAAIRAVDNMGFIDVDRLGHGGHSYGAFATANILARAPYFKAGIAGDGAYNRSLTPTGFQSERRDIWEAPHVYIEMSPFFVADQIDTPLLMYHGMDDNNTGTWPIQSDRMIHALTALGKTAVLVKYPYESHAPRAIEQQLDLWARWIDWFDRYVKGAETAEKLTEAQGLRQP